MRRMRPLVLLAGLGLALGLGGATAAQEGGPAKPAETETPTAPVLEVQPVVEGVWAIVGPMAQRDPANLGNNATFGAVETADGVVLIDPGGSYKGAQMLEAALRRVTQKPIVAVIDTGGQDHRWLGNGYFKAQGAEIIASAAAVEDQQERASLQFTMLRSLIGEDGLEGTQAVHADRTFADALDLEIGGVKFEVRHVGPAHTPGDAFVWLPGKDVVFTGDIVYVERLLGVMDHSSSKGWLVAFEAIEKLEPKWVVPGHGHASPLVRARVETYGYLTHLRREVGKLIESGKGIEESGTVDQSRFSKLIAFEELAGRNAQQVYSEMEFE